MPPMPIIGPGPRPQPWAFAMPANKPAAMTPAAAVPSSTLVRVLIIIPRWWSNGGHQSLDPSQDCVAAGGNWSHAVAVAGARDSLIQTLPGGASGKLVEVSETTVYQGIMPT